MIRKLLKSLLKPAAYPEPTASVRLIETHVSFIFITDDYVYKVKKPVDFGFLNFTTLDRRRFYCEEEVRLNRRLCPEVYLGVVELRGTPEAPRFEGEGPLIDYAVKVKVRGAETLTFPNISFLTGLKATDPRISAMVSVILQSSFRDCEYQTTW